MRFLLSPAADRLLSMERALRRRGIEAAQTNGVSIATFKRDLRVLRAEMGAVVVWVASERRYVLRNPDWPGVLPHVIAEAHR